MLTLMILAGLIPGLDPVTPRDGNPDGRPNPPSALPFSKADADLLRLLRVANDLRLTDEQKSKLRAVINEIDQLPGRPTSRSEAVEKILENFLTPTQRQRLKQIVYQRTTLGHAILHRHEVRQALKVTAAQNDALEKLIAQHTADEAKVRATLPDLTDALKGIDRRPQFDQLRRLQLDYETKAAALLTAQQQGAWKAMHGPPLPQATPPPRPPAVRNRGVNLGDVFRNYSALGPIVILVKSAVQEELKLTDGQKAKAAAMLAEVGKVQRQSRPDLAGKLSVERVDLRRKSNRLAHAAAEKALKELLTPEQRKRLDQVYYQACLTDAFSDLDEVYASLDAVRKAIKLTDDQKVRIRVLEQRHNDDRSKAMRQAPNDFQTVYALEREYTKAMVGVLTEDQRNAWAKLCGPVFDVDKIVYPLPREADGR